MRVLIMTDLEGVSGITDWDAHEPMTPQDQWQRTLMTGEINIDRSTIMAATMVVVGGVVARMTRRGRKRRSRPQK